MERFENDIKNFCQCFYGLKDDEMVRAFIAKLQEILPHEGVQEYYVDWEIRDILNSVEQLAIKSFGVNKA